MTRATEYRGRQDLDSCNSCVLIPAQATTFQVRKNWFKAFWGIVAVQSHRCHSHPGDLVFAVPAYAAPEKSSCVPVLRNSRSFARWFHGKENGRARLEFVKVTLEDLAKRTSNECIAEDEKTHQVIAQANIPPAKGSIRRIFQIAYDEEAGLGAAALLRSRGYGVISVLSNEAAKVLLSSAQEYDLFIIGHAAPEKSRSEMVDWLKAHYPTVKVLALNPLHQPLPSADFNALASDPEGWLSFVTERPPKSASAR